jgi:hypothetical protein
MIDGCVLHTPFAPPRLAIVLGCRLTETIPGFLPIDTLLALLDFSLFPTYNIHRIAALIPARNRAADNLVLVEATHAPGN